MNKSTKNRGVRALIASGIAGASLVAVTMAGSPASGQKYYCYGPVDGAPRYSYCTPETRPEITTTTAEATTTTAAQTTTTQGTSPSTTAPTRPTTTVAPGGSTTTSTAPTGVGAGGGAAPARPIAAQASYTG